MKNVILLCLLVLIIFSCKKRHTLNNQNILFAKDTVENNSIRETNMDNLNNSFVDQKNDIINFITSDYDKNGINDTVYLSEKDSIVKLSIVLNGKKTIETTKLLIPMADSDSERKYNFFLVGSTSDTISLIQEYGATRDGMSYIIYFDKIHKKFIAKYIVYKYVIRETGKVVEDTIEKNKSIEKVNMYKYFKI